MRDNTDATGLNQAQDVTALINDVRNTRKEIVRLAKHLVEVSLALRQHMRRRRVTEELAGAYIMFANASARSATAVAVLLGRVTSIDRVVFSAVTGSSLGSR
jgi:hypothetical protein